MIIKIGHDSEGSVALPSKNMLVSYTPTQLSMYTIYQVLFSLLSSTNSAFFSKEVPMPMTTQNFVHTKMHINRGSSRVAISYTFGCGL